MSEIARTLFAPWVLPVLRIVLLASPVLLISRESDTLHKLMLMGVWMVLNARWVFGKADSNWRNFDFLAEVLVLAIASCKTLYLSKAAASEWLLPLLLVLAIATFVYLLYPGGWLASSDAEKVKPKKKPVWATVAFSLLLGGQGAALAFLDSNSSITSVRSVLILVESACAVTLAGRPSASWIQTWMLLQLCSLPEFYARSDLLFVVCLYTILATLLLLVAQDGHRKGGLPVFSQLWHLVDYGLRLVGRLLTSRVLYLSVLLLSFFTISMAMTEAWHTSTSTTSPRLKVICADVLDVVDEYIKPVWEFTGDPVIQEVLVPAASEIALARLSVFRVLYFLIPVALLGRDGGSYTFTPVDVLGALLSFLGPCISALAVLCSLFPRGDSLARSPVFWLAMTFLNVPFVIFTQVATGIRVQVIRVLFVESEYSRVHTPTGELAALASLCMLGASLLLFVAASHEQEQDEEEEVPPISPAPPRTSGKYRPLSATDRKTWLRWILDGIIAPYVLMLLAAVFVLITAISSGQVPVKSFEMVKVRNLPPQYDWLQLTTLDQLSPAINSLTKLLINAIGPEVRLIPIIALGIRIAEGALECLPCLCIDLGPLETVGSDIVNAFSRRRLLQTHSPWSFDPDHICEARPSESCNGLKVCASDVFKPVAKLSEIAIALFTQALRWASAELPKILAALIPAYDEIEAAFGKVQDVLSFGDFDFTTFANLELPSIRTLLLPDVQLPKLMIPTTSDLIIVGCAFVGAVAALIVFGFAGAVADVVVRGVLVSIVVTVWTWLLFLVVFVYELRDEVRIFTGYEAHVGFDKTACLWFVLFLVLLAMASLTFLAAFAVAPVYARSLPSTPTKEQDVRSIAVAETAAGDDAGRASRSASVTRGARPRR